MQLLGKAIVHCRRREVSLWLTERKGEAERELSPTCNIEAVKGKGGSVGHVCILSVKASFKIAAANFPSFPPPKDSFCRHQPHKHPLLSSFADFIMDDKKAPTPFRSFHCMPSHCSFLPLSLSPSSLTCLVPEKMGRKITSFPGSCTDFVDPFN